jgi:hypothetical protein
MKRINLILGAVLIALSILVSIPLMLKTFRDGGGPWGFGFIELPVLIPLSLYVLFGIAGLVLREKQQRNVFIAGHLITGSAGMFMLFLFPVFPAFVPIMPLTLALFGLLSYSSYRYYLFIMLVLGVIANGLLLKWELDFHRSVPVVELFETSEKKVP